MRPPASIHDLKTLVLSFHPLIAIESVEEERVRSILLSVAGELDLAFFEWSITRGLQRAGGSGAHHRSTEPLALLKHLSELSIRGLFHLKDFSRHLDDAATARQLRETAQSFAASGRSTIVLTGETIRLPAEIEHKTVRCDLALPDVGELRRVVESVVKSIRSSRKIEVDLRGQDLEDYLRALRGLTLNQARQAVAYSLLEDGKLSAGDVQGVLGRKAQMIRDGGLLEYYPADDNRHQLGGFANLKAWLERSRMGFSREARIFNLRPPRGILLVGVQGCGKSLAAKFVAREWRLPLLKLDAGRLFDKYIGESEKNFRKAIALAESMAPVVLWIDEIEKGLTPAGGESDGGLSRRLFGSFLTWLQEKKDEVFVTATANDLSLLPPELLRKGRFDEIFFVDLPESDERRQILAIHLGLRNQDAASFDLKRLVEASEGFSGAELEQAVIAALYGALHRRQALTTDLLADEMRQTLPLSVSRREDVEALREMARGRFASVR
jgi:hypothetical protein